VLEILTEFPSCQPPLEYLLDLVRPIQAREFSISSANKLFPHSLHLTMLVVSFTTPFKRKRTGLCTSWLASLSPEHTDERVRLWIKPASATFRPPRSLLTPVIMVGPGTGLAAFRAFIQERYHHWKLARGAYQSIACFACLGTHERDRAQTRSARPCSSLAAAARARITSTEASGRRTRARASCTCTRPSHATSRTSDTCNTACSSTRSSWCACSSIRKPCFTSLGTSTHANDASPISRSTLTNTDNVRFLMCQIRGANAQGCSRGSRAVLHDRMAATWRIAPNTRRRRGIRAPARKERAIRH